MPAWHALVLPPSIPPAFIHPGLAPSRPPQLPPRLSGKQLPLVTRLPATPWNGPHRRSFYLNGTLETLGLHQIPSPRGGWRPTPGLSAPVHACPGAPRFHASSTLASLPAQPPCVRIRRLGAASSGRVAGSRLSRLHPSLASGLQRPFMAHASVRTTFELVLMREREGRPPSRTARPQHTHCAARGPTTTPHQVGVRLLEGSLKASCLRLKER
eukprot:scaffold8085_cov127-Isochrysis_galbana.AAC.6